MDAVSAPRVPGDRDMPEWWTDADETVLRGELAKLAELPRPPYVEREMHRMVYRPIEVPRRRRWGREVGAWLVIIAALASVILLVSWASVGPPEDPGPIVTRTTYGWPGPTGGTR